MKKLLALLVLLPILFAGCSEEGPTDTDKLGGELGNDEWFKALGKTPKNRTPTYLQKAKGYTSVPIDAWRNVGEPTVTYDIVVSGDEADIPIHIEWPDTVVVVYQNINDTTIIDTVIKPSPYFRGDIKFHYGIVDKKWKLTALTPAKVKSDSAGTYVVLDSIKCEVLNREAGTFPVLSDPATLLTAYPRDDYPYTFQVGDSVKLKVYVSGTAEKKFPLLFAPAPDSIPDWFNYDDAGGFWYGIWEINASLYHWAWIAVCDLDILLDPDMKAARDVMWGIPYRVE